MHSTNRYGAPRRAQLKLLTITTLLVLGSLWSASAAAQTVPPERPEDPWADKLSADHPGYSDSSSTVPRFAIQAEVGVEAIKPLEGDLDLGLGVLGRYGIFENVELRLEVPAIQFLFDRQEQEVTPTLNSVEVGAKLAIPLSDSLQLGLLPHVITPGTEGSSIGGFSGGLGVILDISAGDLGAWLSSVPKMLGLRQPGAVASVDYAFQVDVAAGVSYQLAPNMGVFVETWGVIDDGYMPAADAGIVWHIKPELLLDVYFGMQFPDTALPYGGLGFAYRY